MKLESFLFHLVNRDTDAKVSRVVARPARFGVAC
jgi:hypothetical protein